MEENVEGQVVEEEAKEEAEPKTFLVRCKAKHALGEPEVQIMDTVTAIDEEEAKDYVAGWFAERDFIVTKWLVVTDLERLVRVARNLNP